MRKLISIFAVFVLAMVATSCLDSGLEELETYSGCDITGGQIYYRYYGTNKINASGELEVKQVRLARAVEQDTTTNTYTIAYVTGNVPADQKDKFTQANVVIALDISTAATIAPVNGSPTLGVPADWTEPHQYVVTAANGKKKTWTVVVEPYQ